MKHKHSSLKHKNLTCLHSNPFTIQMESKQLALLGLCFFTLIFQAIISISPKQPKAARHHFRFSMCHWIFILSHTCIHESYTHTHTQRVFLINALLHPSVLIICLFFHTELLSANGKHFTSEEVKGVKKTPSRLRNWDK